MKAPPTKILFPFVGNSVGGSHISTVTLIKSLPKDRFETAIILFDEQGDLAKYLTDEGLKWRHLKLPLKLDAEEAPLKRFIRYQLNALVCRRFLKRNKVDLVHTGDMRMHMLWSFSCHKTDVQHIWHQRTLFPKSRLSYLALKRCSYVIAISKAVQASIPHKINPKSSVVYNPIKFDEISEFEIAEKRSILSKGSEDNLIIGMAANLRAVKQPFLTAKVIEKLSILLDRPVTLVVLGEDREDCLPEMLSLINPKRNRILAMGFQAPVLPWIAALDVLISTSKGDGFGRSLVEAMGVGTPVVATDLGGHKEIINSGKNGLLCRDDPETIACNIAKLMSEPLLREEIVKAGQAVRQTFSPEKHRIAIEKIYDQL